MKDLNRVIRKRGIAAASMHYPITPDGRYFVVRGRLWRRINPTLPQQERVSLIAELIRARSAARHARRDGDDEALLAAKRDIEAAKTALGERGPPWWSDGTADLSRQPAQDSPYRQWFVALQGT